MNALKIFHVEIVTTGVYDGHPELELTIQGNDEKLWELLKGIRELIQDINAAK